MTGHEKCAACQAPISEDEAAITKKLINRGTTRFYCVKCLAEAFDVREEEIRKKIQYFKQTGCTLFQKERNENEKISDSSNDSSGNGGFDTGSSIDGSR